MKNTNQYSQMTHVRSVLKKQPIFLNTAVNLFAVTPAGVIASLLRSTTDEFRFPAHRLTVESILPDIQSCFSSDMIQPCKNDIKNSSFSPIKHQLQKLVSYQSHHTSDDLHTFSSTLIDILGPRCSQLYSIDDPSKYKKTGTNSKKLPKQVQCSSCSLVWCFRCQAPWHENLTCKEFVKGDKMLHKWMNEKHEDQWNARKCPKCSSYIQRNGGRDFVKHTNK